MRAFWLGLLLLSCACSNHRYFVPRENTNGTGPGGYPAAVYRIDAGVLGGSVGEVRVWSEGAHFVDTEDSEEVELHLGFEIENTSTVPLALDLVTLRLADVTFGRTRLELEPVRTEGVADAAPGTTTRIDAFFRPGHEPWPQDINGFSARFRILAGGQPALTQVTPFAPYSPHDYWYGDPWMWGPGYWGYGVGFGFGYGWHDCH
jgi:hypothetical protein